MRFENEDSAVRVVQVMRRKVASAPDSAGFYTLGSAELYLDLTEDAVKHLQRAVALRPDFAEAHAALCAAHLAAGNPAAARTHGARAEELGCSLAPELKARLG